MLLLSTTLQRLDPEAAAATTRAVLGDPQQSTYLDPEQLAEAICRSRPQIESAALWESAAGGVAHFDQGEWGSLPAPCRPARSCCG